MPKKQEQVLAIAHEFDLKVEQLNTRLHNYAKRLIQRGIEPDRAYDIALIHLSYKTSLETIIVAATIETINVRRLVKDEILFKKWELDKVWPGDELNLSQTITKNIRTVRKEIKQNLKAGNSWTQTTVNIRRTGKVEAKLPKYLNDLVKAAKKAKLSPKDMNTYKRAMNKALGNIKRLADNGAPTTALKKAYANLVKKSETFNEKAITKAIDRAIRNKSNYFSQRIARTEIARANAVAVQITIDKDKDAIGWKSMLSTRHKITDICDFHAKADLFGMGPGVKPRRVDIQYPYHSFCMCYAMKVYTGKSTGNFSLARGAKFLKDNPKIEKGITTQKSRKTLLKKPLSWPTHLQNWSSFQKLPRPPKGVVR